MSDAAELRYVGTRPVRPDGLEKVTGKANFGADEYLPGMIHGVVLRSPHAHARIVAMDASRALALDGVHAVVTASDFPSRDGISVNRKRLFENIIAGDKVLYHGHPVAAVAAKTRELANRAAALIDVRYEVLPHVLDMQDAMKPDAPLLHDDMFTQGLAHTPDAPSNVNQKTTIAKGDVEAGFAQADVIVERTFVTPMVHQGYIEPHACVADANADGRVDLWCSSQGHFGIRDMAGLVLGMDTGDIRVIPAEIGGGFGGKTVVYLEPLAMKPCPRLAGRPVKMVMSPRGSIPRHRARARHHQYRQNRLHPKDGTITAMSADLLYESGAFPRQPAGRGSDVYLRALRRRQPIRIEGYEVVLNKPRVNAYRAPGAHRSPCLPVNRVLDEIAQQLNMDPIDLRLRERRDGRQPALPTVHASSVSASWNVWKPPKPTPTINTPLERKPGSRCRSRFLVQRRQQLQRRGACGRIRHDPDRRGQPGHRRQPRLHGDHGGGNAAGAVRAYSCACG